jgi:hypothetical protein
MNYTGVKYIKINDKVYMQQQQYICTQNTNFSLCNNQENTCEEYSENDFEAEEVILFEKS